MVDAESSPPPILLNEEALEVAERIQDFAGVNGGVLLIEAEDYFLGHVGKNELGSGRSAFNANDQVFLG